MSDWQAKQGDTAIALLDTLTYSDGTSPNLAGATVKCILRLRSANAPSTNLAATVTSSTAPATVSYTLTAADTANAGLFQQSWQVTFSGGQIETFPTDGYNTLEIQENLLSPNVALVELDDAKDYLNITTKTHDGELLRFLAGLTPVVEFITGPILPKTYTNERYDGGRSTISLRHRPLIAVASVTEYLGPIAYSLTQISSRDQGTIYSYEFDPSGSIIRTTSGGGTQAFPAGPDTVQVTYTAGFLKTPENVRLGLLEALRTSYQETQQAGGGRLGTGGYNGDDALPTTQMMAFLASPRVREFLAPNRRHPATL